MRRCLLICLSTCVSSRSVALRSVCNPCLLCSSASPSSSIALRSSPRLLCVSVPPPPQPPRAHVQVCTCMHKLCACSGCWFIAYSHNEWLPVARRRETPDYLLSIETLSSGIQPRGWVERGGSSRTTVRARSAGRFGQLSEPLTVCVCVCVKGRGGGGNFLNSDGWIWMEEWCLVCGGVLKCGLSYCFYCFLGDGVVKLC